MNLKFVTYDPDESDTVGRRKGFIVVTIKAFLKDCEVGRIKMSYIPKSLWDELYGNDIIAYARLFRGSYECEQRARERFEVDYKQSYDFLVDKPTVGYILVDEKFKRRGIGTQLYFEAAKWCQSKGLRLYASGIQSESAQAVWRHMSDLSSCRVIETKFRLSPRRREFRRYLEVG